LAGWLAGHLVLCSSVCGKKEMKKKKEKMKGEVFPLGQLCLRLGRQGESTGGVDRLRRLLGGVRQLQIQTPEVCFQNKQIQLQIQDWRLAE